MMKEIEAELFKDASLKEETLIPFGFTLENESYLYSSFLPSTKLRVEVTIDKEGAVDGTIYDDEEEFEGYRHQVLGEFSASVKEEYVNLLREIRGACFEIHAPISYYLVPSNPRIYDIDRGFRENAGMLDWPAKRRIHEGDVVFIYSAVPFKGIAFRCVVISVSEAPDYYRGKAYYPTLIQLVERYEKGRFPLDECLRHGLKTVRFFHKVSEEFAKYINEN